MSSPQAPLMTAWATQILPDFDYLGPFPIAAREQHQLSPFYPLSNHDKLIPSLDHSELFSSSIADDGHVSWSRGVVEPDGSYVISYPSIRWSDLRAKFGWSALQHHSLVHSVLEITTARSLHSSEALRVRVRLEQASYIAFVPRGSAGENLETIEWHEGDVYAQSPHDAIIVLPPAIVSENGRIEYDVYLSVDYEIRLFGDPQVSSSDDIPRSQSRLSVTVLDPDMDGVVIGDAPIVPDVIDGWLYGDVIGLYLENLGGWRDVTAVEHDSKKLSVSLEKSAVSLAPYQKRLLALTVEQDAALPSSETELSFTLVFGTSGLRQNLTIPLTHRRAWEIDSDPNVVIHQTHRKPFLSDSYIIPPYRVQNENLPPAKPILALHGAGVEVSWEPWTSAIRRREANWIVLARGLTPWGYDWRGPSALDALAALDAVRTREAARTGKKTIVDTALVVGHSNGGQGTLGLASRYPDLFPASIPLAGYLSASSYVPVTPMAHGLHFTDPALQGILAASTAGGDNDVLLGNMATRRSRIFHGGSDENVPVWNSRKALNVIKTWNPQADVNFTEVPGKPHWWDGLFQMNSTEAAIAELLDDNRDLDPASKPAFTLTVMWPRESGSLRGWSILETKVPGRLARLHVRGQQVRTTNVQSFSVSGDACSNLNSLLIDGQEVVTNGVFALGTSACYFAQDEEGRWKTSPEIQRQNSGPLSRVLNHGSPISLVVPREAKSSGSETTHTLRIALRLAHNLLTYLNLDCEIVTDEELLRDIDDGVARLGGKIVVGAPDTNLFARRLQDETSSPFAIRFGSEGKTFRIVNQVFDQPGVGLLYMHPHSDALVLYGTSPAGYERAVRAFPLRTGIPNPEWIVLGTDTDMQGAGGILGAGFWGRDGGFSESMSWLI